MRSTAGLFDDHRLFVYGPLDAFEFAVLRDPFGADRATRAEGARCASVQFIVSE